ncbi:MAG: transcriptional regulator [Variovorax paradoxus]|jgi:predicted DNA-binding transcriptional regulator YafY|nr:MAG: transcriptional regulator [Variovorax paradoxus]PZQ01835.1 MAG: transcriptional regulator [Variovorax paradoxus]
MSRAARLLNLLELLRAQRRPLPGPQLAAQAGISLRTLYRDVATLREQGARIDGDPGVGYVLRPGFTLPPLMFSEEELEALVLGARWVASQSADPALACAAQGVMNRIGATLPEALRMAVETSGLFVPPRADPRPTAPWLPALRQAVRAEHAVWLDYLDEAGQTTRRRVWPFAVAFFDHARLMAAWCELRQDFRHFRADRVLDLTDTGERYPERRHLLIRRWSVHMGHARHAHTADRS